MKRSLLRLLSLIAAMLIFARGVPAADAFEVTIEVNAGRAATR